MWRLKLRHPKLCYFWILSYCILCIIFGSDEFQLFTDPPPPREYWTKSSSFGSYQWHVIILDIKNVVLIIRYHFRILSLLWLFLDVKVIYLCCHLWILSSLLLLFFIFFPPLFIIVEKVLLSNPAPFSKTLIMILTYFHSPPIFWRGSSEMRYCEISKEMSSLYFGLAVFCPKMLNM
jgi:hypothetical protein